MSDFVLVRHDNGIVAPVGRSFAELRNLTVVEGDAERPDGRLVGPVRENGRPVKKKTTVKKAAAKRTAAKKTTATEAAEDKAVTPPEGAAETTLTTPKE